MDLEKIDASVKNRLNWHWLESKDNEGYFLSVCMYERSFFLPALSIDCASLARIRTLGPVKCASLFPSCVKAMYVGPYGTKVVPKMFEYVRDLHGL